VKVHSCAQDDVSYPGKPFAVGLTLEALSAHTVDESGKEAFVTQNPLKLLRKVRPFSCRLPDKHSPQMIDLRSTLVLESPRHTTLERACPETLTNGRFS